ncbi:MAG: ABC transporter permease [Tannerella sp.]|jgi:ABC-2 type transport system permease protein|nr:ABC transporter permease [Tannerella sp.]
MKKIVIVTKREYLRRVNKKSFIFITLLAPLLFAALMFVPLWLSSIKSGDIYEVAIMDRTGKYASLFEDTDMFRFVGDAGHMAVEESKNSRPDIFAFLEITDDLLENPNAVTLYSEKQIPQDLKREVNRVLRQHLEKEKRASFNIPNIDEIIEKSSIHIDVQTIKWGKDGTESESSSGISSIIGMVFTFIIYMFIMMYGAMVMQSVMEEKTNRIVEVIVSSVRPFDLMMGKITGIGLVGITQVFIWCILTMILVGLGGMFMGAGGGHDMSVIPSGMQYGMTEMSSSAGILSKLSSFNFIEIIIYFVLFFTGGYISYASLFAAVGSVVDSPEDSQQFMTPLMVLLIFAVYTGMYSINNPDGPLAFWCSLIPFTSPVVMMVRIPYEIPFWQILTSLVLLFASDIFFVWLSAKIYRVGILMYGKKPDFKEIARWVKY